MGGMTALTTTEGLRNARARAGVARGMIRHLEERRLRQSLRHTARGAVVKTERSLRHWKSELSNAETLVEVLSMGGQS
jgi:hypothetical protein